MVKTEPLTPEKGYAQLLVLSECITKTCAEMEPHTCTLTEEECNRCHRNCHPPGLFESRLDYDYSYIPQVKEVK